MANLPKSNKICSGPFKVTWILYFLLGWTASVRGQNLVPNPSFETIAQCPIQLGSPNGGPLDAVPWIAYQSANNFHPCADPMYCGAPDNFKGHQVAFDGAAYAGGYFHAYANILTEFIYTMLLDTLEEDSCYKVSAWINLADDGCGCDKAGILLTPDVPTQFVGANPQINWGGEYLSDSINWTNVIGYHIGLGTERYITIGNFASHANTSGDKACWGPPASSYYYIDYVEVVELPIQQISVDLGGPVTACDSFVIDPGGDPDVVYNWSTGHQGHTLTVYTSGVYSVTASYACTTADGDIEVTILHPHQVNLGPDTFVLCEGDDYEINLDPDLGTYTWQDGSEDPDYTISAGGLYSVTLDDGCVLSSDTVEVTMMDIPLPFTLGQDTFLCPGESYDIVFDPSLGTFEWQDGSDDSFYTIDNDLTYALTISNMCGEQSDELNVESVDPPNVSLGPDTLFLCGGEVFDINLDPDVGMYIWQDGSQTEYYTFATTGLYSVTVTNACGTDMDNIFVYQQDVPVVELGASQTACPGDTLDLSTSPETGVYTWQDGSHGTSFEVTGSGTYTLTVTNACGTSTDTVEIQYASPITPPSLGPDLTLCPGQQAVLYAASPGAQYVWNDMSTADSLVVTGAGMYHVTASSACGSYSDTVMVSVSSEPPMLALPADFILCQGQMVTLDAGVSGVTYVWSDGSMMPQLQVSTPGTYSLTVSNTCGTSIDTVVIGAGDIAPSVALGADVSICAGDTLNLTPVFDHVDTWLWQDGSVLPTLEVTTPGEYHVEVTNGCGSAYDTINVGQLPGIPMLDLGADASVCPGQLVTFSIGLSGVSIEWSDGSTGPSLTVNGAATVYATISNSCGVSSDTAGVTLLPSPPQVDLGPDQTICPGETFVMDPGLTGVGYVWQDGSVNPTYQATVGGTYMVTVSTVCGSTSDTLTLMESTTGPMVDLGPDIEACEGETVTIRPSISGVQYLWQDGSIQPELTVNSSGAYSLMVSNLCGVDMDTVLVEFNPLPPPQDLGGDTSLCEGQSLVLHAVTGPGMAVSWQDQSQQPTFTVTTAGIYSVVVENQCGLTTDEVEVSYTYAPEPFDLGPDSVICRGELVVLSAPASPYMIRWSDGSAAPILTVHAAGVYSLDISNECGMVSDSVEVAVNQDVPLVQLQPEWLWCPGDQFTLHAEQSFAATYLWNTGATSSFITVNTPGVYTVEVKSACGEAGGSSEVLEKDDCLEGPVFYVPNVFSPDGNGINDVFSVYTDQPDQVISMQGKIFDRWGNLLFESAGQTFSWDGRFGEALMSPGVYVYVIKVMYTSASGQKEYVLTGDVTLIK